MNIRCIEQSGCTIVEVSGRLDAVNSERFEEECKEQLALGKDTLVITLSGVEYISSAGLRGILAIAKVAKGQKTTLAFCDLQPQVAEVFTISGFMSILSIHPNLEAAIAFMNAK